MFGNVDLETFKRKKDEFMLAGTHLDPKLPTNLAKYEKKLKKDKTYRDEISEEIKEADDGEDVQRRRPPREDVDDLASHEEFSSGEEVEHAVGKQLSDSRKSGNEEANSFGIKEAHSDRRIREKNDEEESDVSKKEKRPSPAAETKKSEASKKSKYVFGDLPSQKPKRRKLNIETKGEKRTIDFHGKAYGDANHEDSKLEELAKDLEDDNKRKELDRENELAAKALKEQLENDAIERIVQ